MSPDPLNETERSLARLSFLLQLPSPLDSASDITLEQLAAWKPIIERTTFEDPQAAEELARLVVAAAESACADDVLALAHWTSGNVSFLLDRPLDALDAYARAEAMYRSRAEPLQIARMSVGKLSALDKVGRYEEALRCGQFALPILASSPDLADQRRTASIYNGLGISSEHTGRLAEALAAYEHKRHWWRDRDGDAARVEAARTLINIGVVNARLGQYTEAHAAFTDAYQALAQPSASAQMLNDAARCAMNLAWLEALRRSPPEVVAEAFGEARRARSLVDPTGASTDLALVDLFEAEWRADASDAGEALGASIAALQARFAAAGLAYEAARAQLLLARLALAGGDSAAARDTYMSVAAHATERGDAEIAYLAGVGQARADRASGNLVQGRETLEKVIDAVEATRGRLQVEEHRTGFLEDKLIAYRELASVCLAQGDMSGVLQAVERSRARTLAEILAPATLPSPQAPQDDPALAALDEEQHRLQAELAASADDGVGRRGLERDLMAVRRRWAERTASYGASIADVMPTMDVAYRLLPPDTLLLVYGALPEGVLLFVFDRNGMLTPPRRVAPLPHRDGLRLDLARITSVARLPRPTVERSAGQQIRSAQVPLAEWFNRYLGPVREELARYTRLLIIPDDLLNSLPFNALYDREAGRYLVQDHEVLIAPSLTTWTQLAGRAAVRSPTGVAVGCSCDGRLGRAAEEAHTVASMLDHATLLLEGQATRANLAAASAGAGVIHIATHGVYRADAPAFSYLELADGPLEAFDIAQMRLAAATVVLSACETGVGHLTGNELMGLARAFLHAGAASVLATHWPVDDEAMATVVAGFVQRLAAGKPVARALRETQAGWLADHNGEGRPALMAHPFFWGALTLVGVDSTLSAPA